ncbi:hypothetical protein PAXRUDRAFT_468248 [Paxillus rubicundulus Ve08.2h10]|uniref:Uncharacterized protein n=1 Tax=Paxillus rubicundulus Ve08.2h10 TaxID=930991 RepID=A0A0D0DAM8_9AGAM|nr:hypothetical protein PAXRUDRAFT_468248 [Paxillus rubicundulus Ve08.2h10]
MFLFRWGCLETEDEGTIYHPEDMANFTRSRIRCKRTNHVMSQRLTSYQQHLWVLCQPCRVVSLRVLEFRALWTDLVTRRSGYDWFISPRGVADLLGNLQRGPAQVTMKGRTSSGCSLQYATSELRRKISVATSASELSSYRRVATYVSGRAVLYR